MMYCGGWARSDIVSSASSAIPSLSHLYYWDLGGLVLSGVLWSACVHSPALLPLLQACQRNTDSGCSVSTQRNQPRIGWPLHLQSRLLGFQSSSATLSDHFDMHWSAASLLYAILDLWLYMLVQVKISAVSVFPATAITIKWLIVQEHLMNICICHSHCVKGIDCMQLVQTYDPAYLFNSALIAFYCFFEVFRQHISPLWACECWQVKCTMRPSGQMDVHCAHEDWLYGILEHLKLTKNLSCKRDEKRHKQFLCWNTQSISWPFQSWNCLVTGVAVTWEN